MADFVAFGTRTYALLFLILLISRALDFFSTWVATPNLVLEGNPIAKKMGWRWGIPVNGALCFLFAFWPLPGIVIATTSVLVAARNFQSAWLMRSLGEAAYRKCHIEWLAHTSALLYVFCLVAHSGLVAIVGGAVVYFATEPVLLAIGIGIVAYAVAVVFYSLLGFWRLRRSSVRLDLPPTLPGAGGFTASLSSLPGANQQADQ